MSNEPKEYIAITNPLGRVSIPESEEQTTKHRTSLFVTSDTELMFDSEARTMIRRDGLEDLLSFLHKTDFYYAPASTRYHGAKGGGLLEHSLSVYKWIFSIADNPLLATDGGFYPEELTTESMAIVSLFHDVCKINTYSIDYKNAKNPETGAWERVPYFKMEDINGFGSHAARSTYIIQQFMQLKEPEFIAILHHMGAWDKSTYSDPGRAYEKHPLSWVLHVADEAATYISKK